MEEFMNFNKVILGGHITADPELKQTPSGVSVVTFGLAVNRKGKAENQPNADFFNVTAWKGLAEHITRYFRKGSGIIVTGRIQNRSWTDRDGTKRYATDIIAEEAEFADSKGEKTEEKPEEKREEKREEEPHYEPLSPDEELPF